jgi:hypothetical protein
MRRIYCTNYWVRFVDCQRSVFVADMYAPSVVRAATTSSACLRASLERRVWARGTRHV